MLDIASYLTDISTTFNRQFERRGLTIVSTETKIRENSTKTLCIGSSMKFDIFLNETHVGVMVLACNQRKKRPGFGSSYSFIARIVGVISYPVDEHLQPSYGINHPIAEKVSGFKRLLNSAPIIKGPPIYGRPKIRRFAAWAAKQFAEAYMPQFTAETADFIHSV